MHPSSSRLRHSPRRSPLASGLESIRPSLAPQGHDAQATPPPHDVDGLTTAELDEITACRGNSDRCRLVPSVAGSGSASSLGARDPMSIAKVTPSYRTPSADGWQARSEREPAQARVRSQREQKASRKRSEVELAPKDWGADADAHAGASEDARNRSAPSMHGCLRACAVWL